MHSTNRRQFLASSVAAAGAAAVSKYALAADSAKSFPKIDCHTHFWEHRDEKGFPLPSSMMPKDLKAVALPLGVTGTVVVEASALVEDNQWLLDLAKDDPYIVGVVGNLSPGKEDFAKHLERFAKNKLFRGIRVNAEPLTTGLKEQAFIDDVKRLADLDLELDVNGGPDMPADVARLADKLPTLRIVVNHAANQDVDGKAPPEKWVTNMKAAAAHPQVFCKVSALVDQGWPGGKAPADLAIYKPLLDACWEIWGEDRVIYGSNWPVSEQYAPYKVVIGIVEQYLKDKSPAVQEKYFVLNSIKAYKWSPR